MRQAWHDGFVTVCIFRVCGRCHQPGDLPPAMCDPYTVSLPCSSHRKCLLQWGVICFCTSAVVRVSPSHLFLPDTWPAGASRSGWSGALSLGVRFVCTPGSPSLPLLAGGGPGPSMGRARAVRGPPWLLPPLTPHPRSARLLRLFSSFLRCRSPLYYSAAFPGAPFVIIFLPHPIPFWLTRHWLHPGSHNDPWRSAGPRS